VVATRSTSKALLRQNNQHSNKNMGLKTIVNGNSAILGMFGVVGIMTVACWLGYPLHARSSGNLDIGPDSAEEILMIDGAAYASQEDEQRSLTVLGATGEVVDPPSSSPVFGTVASRYIFLVPMGGLVFVCIVLCVALKRSLDGCRRFRQEMADKVFEMETLQASMRILESELERKILQPDGGKVDTSDLFGGQHVKGGLEGAWEEDEGDMIRAGWGPEQDETCGLCDDAVESFLQDRGALAIQEDQVDRWMKLEEEYGVLNRQLKELKDILQLHVPGDKRSKTEKIHEAIFLLDNIHLE